MNIKKWEKDPVERLHTQFYNYLKLLDNKEQVTLYLNIRHYIFLTILKKLYSWSIMLILSFVRN